MKILLIDTVTSVGSIALFNDDKLLGEITFNTELKHLKVLHIAIKYLLDICETDLNQLNLIGVDIGPGSFTGIRISLTAAKAFSQVLKIGLEGVESLKILAYQVPFDNSLIVPLIDGKKGRVYTSVFKKESGNVKNLTEYYDISPDNLIKILKKDFKEKNLIFTGDGLIPYKEKFLKELENITILGEDFYYPRAKNIYYLVNKENFNKDYERIDAFYLRKSDAEEKF